MTKVTYRPGVHDPATLEWNGVTFEANIPVDLTDENAVEIDFPERVEMEDGTIRTRTRRRKIPMVDLAKNNPSGVFLVEGHEPAKRGRKPSPKTPEEYKRWATHWIGEALDHELLAQQWESEEKLRDKCGCGEAIERELNALFTRRSDELKRAAGFEEKRKRQRLEAEIEAA